MGEIYDVPAGCNIKSKCKMCRKLYLNIKINVFILRFKHPAGTSKDSDKCDLSKDSEIGPLTLGSMDNSFFYHLFCFTQESYLSKDLGEIYIWKNL